MTLTQLFTAIANQIRRIKGTSESIIAEDFPKEMADIEMGELTDEEYIEANEDLDNILENTVVPSGTLNITENGEYDVTNYTGANVNITSEYNAKTDVVGMTKTTSGYKTFLREIDVANWDTSQMNSFEGMFYQCNGLTKIDNINSLNTANITNLYGTFYWCASLTNLNVKDWDVRNVTTMYNTFNYCLELTTIDLSGWNTGKNETIRGMFEYCQKLTSINFGNEFTLSGCIYSASLYNAFNQCTSLDNNTLNDILGLLLTATQYPGTKTLKQIGLTSAQATICTTLPNWQDCVNAGWATGY